MKNLLSKIIERARAQTSEEFAAEVAQYRSNEFAMTLRALESFIGMDFFKFGKSFEINSLESTVEVKEEDFTFYEFSEAANDHRFCLAA